MQWARLGDLNLVLDTDDAAPENFQIVERIRHPGYKPPNRYHDIALLKLERPVKFNLYIQPICLETRENLTYTLPVATGWGALAYNGDSSPHLQKVYLNYFSSQNCSAAYSDISKRVLSEGISDKVHICAGGVNEQRDTCQVNI